MHQSAVRSPRPLAEGGCCWSGRQRRPLPFLRRFPTQRAAAARSAFAYAAAFAHHARAARPAPALNRALLASAFPSVETRPLRRSSAAISASGPRCPSKSTPRRFGKIAERTLARQDQEGGQQPGIQLSTRPFSKISSSVSQRSGMLADPRRRMSSSAPRTSRR
jgi:hypothetical protein